jgi:hypothetical protein
VVIPGFLAESKDAGNIWNPVEKQPTADLLSDLTVSAAGDRICVTTDTDVWSTSDGCHSWSRIPLPAELAAPGEPALCAIQLLDDGSLFLIGPQAGSPRSIAHLCDDRPVQLGRRSGRCRESGFLPACFSSAERATGSVGHGRRFPASIDCGKPRTYGPSNIVSKTKNKLPISDGFDVAVIEGARRFRVDPRLMAVAASIDLHTHIHISLTARLTWTARVRCRWDFWSTT